MGGAADNRPAGRMRAPGFAVGVSEEMIGRMVHEFYARVRRNSVLGPIFDEAIGDGWDDHLAKLCDFWSSVILMTGRYKGQPMPAHARLPDIQPSHFGLWLEIFRETAAEIVPPEAAALFINRAERIGESLKLGIAFHRGELPNALRTRPA